MALTPQTEVREVQVLTNQQKASIREFLQGAVYCWCKNRKDEWFSMRDLMGGDNYEWEGTPLFDLYAKQTSKGVLGEAAVDQAGKDGGWLLKRVISDDKRNFETKKEEQIRKHRWIADA